MALTFTPLVALSQATLSGYVYDAQNGETLIGVTLYDKKSGQGATTNPYGFFSLSLPQDTLSLRVSYIGYETIFRTIHHYKSDRIDFNLSPKAETLKEVVVTDERFVVEEEVRSTRMGVFSLTPKEIATIPSIGGGGHLESRPINARCFKGCGRNHRDVCERGDRRPKPGNSG